MINLAGEVVVASTDWAAELDGAAYDARYMKSMALMAVCTVAASTAKTFVDANVNTATDKITITGHGYATGRKVAATSGGTLPGGLSATNYYVIKIDADTIKLATSAANALLGTAVDITSAAGGGTHTLTPAALSTASLKLQWSNNDIDWYDLANQSQNISATGNLGFLVTDNGFKSIRALGSIAAGQVNVVITANVLKYRFP